MKYHFKEKLRRPKASTSENPWGFIILPKETSAGLPRRGRTTIEGEINGHSFQVTLDPDGQLSHWMRVEEELLQTIGAAIGDLVNVEIMPVDQEPEPELPLDLREALAVSPEARVVWDDTTVIARLDWIHWIVSAKQNRTRIKRISNACDMLAAGKRRVCCFDQSGYYSKAFTAPKEVN